MSQPSDLRDNHFSIVSTILLRVVVVIGVVELLIMLMFDALKLTMHPNFEAMLDAVILGLVSTPILYYWVVRPFVRQRDKAVEQVRHLAYHDELTSLGNRRLMMDALRRSEARYHRYHTCYAVLLIDLDGFKKVNDEHGHEAGDAVLREVAYRIKEIMRVEDETCRLGGDEFVVIAQLGQEDEQSSRAKVDAIGGKLLHVLSQPVTFRHRVFHVGCSIGVAMMDGRVMSGLQLLGEADKAMYAAKQRGKGQVVCYSNEVEGRDLSNVHVLRA